MFTMYGHAVALIGLTYLPGKSVSKGAHKKIRTLIIGMCNFFVYLFEGGEGH